MIPIIERNVKKAAKIYNDGWSAYCKLNEAGYFTVLHKYYFKKSFINSKIRDVIEVHTTRIEGGSAYKHTYIQTYKHTDIQTYRHTNIQTYNRSLHETTRNEDIAV